MKPFLKGNSKLVWHTCTYLLKVKPVILTQSIKGWRGRRADIINFCIEIEKKAVYRVESIKWKGFMSKFYKYNSLLYSY